MPNPSRLARRWALSGYGCAAATKTALGLNSVSCTPFICNSGSRHGASNAQTVAGTAQTRGKAHMNIPKMAEREEALRLFLASGAAEKAYDAAVEAAEDKGNEISRKYTKLHEELEEKENEERGVLELYKKYQAARDAYTEHPEEIETSWKSGEGHAPVRCAKSGHVILESDEVVKDGHTGEVWLRAALGLPARPAEEELEEEAA